MILIQYRLGLGKVLLDFPLHAPGDRQQPVQIVPDDCRFGNVVPHCLELVQFGNGLFPRFLRQLGCGNSLLQLLDLRLFLGVAQLPLDRLHLLMQVVFALGSRYLRLHPPFQLLLDKSDVVLLLGHLQGLLEPLLDIGKIEQFLLLRD